MSGNEENGVGTTESFDESEQVHTEELVIIHDGEADRHCVVLVIAEMDGDEFALLAPQNQLHDAPEDEDEASLELFIFRYRLNEQGDEVFEGIEDDTLFEQVREFFSTLIDTESANDEDEDEDVN
jgi:hypothetical protein